MSRQMRLVLTSGRLVLGAAIRAEGGLVSITDVWGRVAPVVVVIIDDSTGTCSSSMSGLRVTPRPYRQT